MKIMLEYTEIKYREYIYLFVTYILLDEKNKLKVFFLQINLINLADSRI